MSDTTAYIILLTVSLTVIGVNAFVFTSFKRKLRRIQDGITGKKP